MGTSTQMGRQFNVVIHIEQFSTPDDRKALMEAFACSRQHVLVDVLEDMKPKGRIRTRWGVGNDIKYIFELSPSEKGRHLRLITDRRIIFGEAYRSTRSEEYSIGAVDWILTPDGKGSGTLLPACQLTVNKKTQQIEIGQENFSGLLDGLRRPERERPCGPQTRGSQPQGGGGV